MNGKTEEAPWFADWLNACSPDAGLWELAHAFLSLGNLQYEAGLDEAAENALARSLEYYQLAEVKYGVVFAGSKLALLKHQKGEFQEAQAGMLGALKSATHSIDLYIIAFCLDSAAQLAAKRMARESITGSQNPDKTAHIFGAVDHWREILSLPRGPREKSAYFQAVENLRRWMGERSYLHAWKAGRSFPVERVLHEAVELFETPHLPRKNERLSTEVEGFFATLSERERQVISLVAEGLTNQEIAARLFITERTVRFHITSIFNKLGAENRAQAVAIVDRLGILLNPTRSL